MAKFANKAKGNWGEKIAAKYLTKNGYRVLTTNFTTTIGELDIVATDDNEIIFVEVKTRSDNSYGAPCEAVDSFKRRKINQVASQYIKKFQLYSVAIRFDVIEVYLSGEVNHLKGAFDSYLRY